jgi:hypothetical protein
VNVTPTGPKGEPPGAPPETQAPQHEVPTTKEFPKDLKGKPQAKETTGEVKKRPPTKEPEHKKKHAGAATKKEEQALEGFLAAVGGREEGVAGVTSAKGGVAGGSPVDRIIQVFHDNQFFNATAVQQVRVSTQGPETLIGVSLNNGVEVSINLAPGGRELNITIAGLSAMAQAQADNPENQALLQARLAEQGFIVHQIQTYRAETPPAAPIAPTLRPEIGAHGAGEARGRGREERGEGGAPGEGGRGGEGEGRGRAR